jgi:RimJ/RimL family protein N-acetyltransferase
MHQIETSRLILRPFVPEDLDALFLIRSNPELMQYIRDGQPLSREETKKNLDNIIQHYRNHNFGLWAVIYKQNQALIGFCGLQYLEQTLEVELGYMLTQEYWGLGIATEAGKASLRYGFEELKLEKIVAVAKPENLASRGVMEKLGMVYVKTARYYNTDVVYYAISKEMFLVENSVYVLS